MCFSAILKFLRYPVWGVDLMDLTHSAFIGTIRMKFRPTCEEILQPLKNGFRRISENGSCGAKKCPIDPQMGSNFRSWSPQ